MAQSKRERYVRPELSILSKLSPPPWFLWIQNHSGAEREKDGLDMVEAPETRVFSLNNQRKEGQWVLSDTPPLPSQACEPGDEYTGMLKERQGREPP